jgi:CheY-like chemotaxis protein
VAVVVNQAPSASVTDVLSEIGPMRFDVPVLSCWVPEKAALSAELGVQDYLVKPIRRDDLTATVKRVAPKARTILLVDDDPEARQLFRRMLAGGNGNEGYVVLHAQDGEMALSLLKTRCPDLLLLDLVMPNVDGFAVLEAMAEDPGLRDVPVVVISARDPQQEPILSKVLTTTRQVGLSARDLTAAIDAMSGALQPRFGAPVSAETRPV